MPLAYYKPASPVPKFKYARGGQSELCRGVAGPNHKLFYQGWASYLRAAYGHNGTLPHTARPSPTSYLLTGKTARPHTAHPAPPPICLRAQRHALMLPSPPPTSLLLNQPVVQKQLSGTLTFLENVGACPVAIFLCRADASVHRLQIGAPIELSSDIVAVAVTPPLATGLDVLKMPTRMFQVRVRGRVRVRVRVRDRVRGLDVLKMPTRMFKATPTPTPTLVTLPLTQTLVALTLTLPLAPYSRP